MNKNRILIVGLALTAIMVVTRPCVALDSLLININQATLITNPDDNNDTRMLVKFELPVSLDTTKYITYAELRFGVTTPQELNRPVNLKVNPITRQWSPEGMLWNGPWTTPGGDFTDTLSTAGVVTRAGQSPVRIEVSHLLMQYVRGLLPNYGLIIRQGGVHRQAVSPAPLNPPSNLAAQLVIYYVDLHPGD